jgi:hypothetical protein
MPVMWGISAMWGSTNRKSLVQAGLGIKQDPASKITKAKRAGSMAQAIEYLPIKCKALNSTPSTNKTNKNPQTMFYYNTGQFCLYQ